MPFFDVHFLAELVVGSGYCTEGQGAQVGRRAVAEGSPQFEIVRRVNA